MAQAELQAGAVRAKVSVAGAIATLAGPAPPYLLDALEECCEGSAALGEVFEHALHALYDAEAAVLSEEAIERWAAAAATSEAAEVAQLLAQAQPFLTWLREAESDDEDEDD